MQPFRYRYMRGKPWWTLWDLLHLCNLASLTWWFFWSLRHSTCQDWSWWRTTSHPGRPAIPDPGSASDHFRSAYFGKLWILRRQKGKMGNENMLSRNSPKDFFRSTNLAALEAPWRSSNHFNGRNPHLIVLDCDSLISAEKWATSFVTSPPSFT